MQNIQTQFGANQVHMLIGPNGSGKSTFLLDLKKQSRERSIYLPPQSDLEHSDSSSELSSGQAMLSLLKDLRLKVGGALDIPRHNFN